MKKVIATILCAFISTMTFATHNRAGEIWVEQVSALRFRAHIVTYTKESSVQADRDSLQINWRSEERRVGKEC